MMEELPQRLTQKQADALLDQADEVVPCLQLGLSDAKRLRDALLDAGVPASLGRDDHCTKGCSPKVLLLARPGDVPRIAELLKEEWVGMLANECGMDDRTVAAFGAQAAPLGDLEQGDPPCPACGHAGPLGEDGACGDCGLVLSL